MTTTAHQEDRLVALASIAAELHSVMAVAWGVSLVAKNAKVISAQAGDTEHGFQPITEFIDEISRQVMDGVNQINHEALQLTQTAVHEQRCIDAYNRFEQVIKNNGDARFINSMSPAVLQAEHNMAAAAGVFNKSLNKLTQLLESMDQHMLSARAIASVSRIVTSNMKGYSDKLKIVADELDKASIYIKEKLSESHIHLGNVKKQTFNRLPPETVTRTEK